MTSGLVPTRVCSTISRIALIVFTSSPRIENLFLPMDRAKPAGLSMGALFTPRAHRKHGGLLEMSLEGLHDQRRGPARLVRLVTDPRDGESRRGREQSVADPV